MEIRLSPLEKRLSIIASILTIIVILSGFWGFDQKTQKIEKQHSIDSLVSLTKIITHQDSFQRSEYLNIKFKYDSVINILFKLKIASISDTGIKLKELPPFKNKIRSRSVEIRSNADVNKRLCLLSSKFVPKSFDNLTKEIYSAIEDERNEEKLQNDESSIFNSQSDDELNYSVFINQFINEDETNYSNGEYIKNLFEQSFIKEIRNTNISITIAENADVKITGKFRVISENSIEVTLKTFHKNKLIVNKSALITY